jgi:hypothetical protein
MSARMTAKVRLQSKTDFQGDQQQLVFAPDYADDRNKEWAKYTPALNLTMTVKSEVGSKHHVGDNYTLVFEPEED